MVVEIVGFQKVEYTKQDGTRVSGANIDYVVPYDGNNCVGVQCNHDYVSSKRIDGPLELGMYDVEFGKGFNKEAYINRVSKHQK